MKNRKASDFERANEFRQLIGLQFFADGEADTDDADDGFLAGFADEDDGLESQQPEQTTAPEEAPDGLESQQPEEQEPAAEQQEQEEQPPAPEMAVLTYNGQQFSVPADVLGTLSKALGVNAQEIIERGMNYEQRGAREIGLLDRYAAASGYDTRAAYLDAMEKQLGEHMVEKELLALQEQYPNTPAEALQPIAERNVADRNAHEAQQARERAAQAAQDEANRQGREKARPWQEFVTAHPDLKAADMPQDFYKLVGEGLSPLAAFERLEGDKARAEANTLREQLKAAQKNNNNRQKSIGGLEGAGDEHDAFLAGLMDED